MDSSLDLLRPSDPGYGAVTSPWTASAVQRPALVARVRSYEGVVDAVRLAERSGLTVAVQCSGHGAAGELDERTLLVDTSRLVSVSVDRAARTAVVGAGTTWGDVAAVTGSSGLSGLAGTSAGVGVAGYTFHGGIGWLARAHGLAAARLTAVSYVDAAGAVRTTSEAVDPEALWVFRGGGGIGVATELEFGLVPAGPVWAGYLLWPEEALGDVAGVWAGLVDRLPESVSTVLGRLGMAPVEPVRGAPVAYLGVCATDLAAGQAFSAAVAGALPAPVVAAVGEMPTSGLGAIHLDPPGPVPALGDSRFLTSAAATADILAAAGSLGEVEVRHVGTVPGPHGALTSAPAPFLLHATGAAGEPGTLDDLAAVLAAAAPVDSGRSFAALRDGQPTAPDALLPSHAADLARIRRERDPAGRVTPARSLTA
ncbi:MAG TPA: FAD-dependent oxidoreductase [Mycobacteriales bacterium]|nr:FAD-dependent oxidoreductase [Mycobacteriales bacterium]